MTIAYGVSPGGGTEIIFNGLADHGAAQFARMVKCGLTWVRLDSFCNTAQINAALAAGLNVLMVVGSYNDGTSTPTAYNTRLVSAINTWYPSITTYEILNEPNNPNNWNSTAGTTNFVKYTSLLQGAYTAAKAVNSGVQIMFGSPGGYGSYGDHQGSISGNDYAGWVNPLTWLEGCYTNGAQGHFDIMGWHPYAYPQPAGGTQSWNCWYQMTDLPTHSARNQMITAGDTAKKIWITENGVPTNGVVGSDPFNWPMGTGTYQQGNLDAALVDLQTRAYIPVFMYFDWADNASDGDWGLNDASYTPKTALATLVKYSSPAAYTRWCGTAGHRGRLTI